MRVNVTKLFVLANATWSALENKHAPIDPVTERIVREIDAIVLGSAGCPLNCCDAPETALAYTGADADPVPPSCKEATQIERCTQYSVPRQTCIDIVVATDEEKQLHDKRNIKRAARAKRAALQKRLDFLLDDIAEAVAAYNIVGRRSNHPPEGSGIL